MVWLEEVSLEDKSQANGLMYALAGTADDDEEGVEGEDDEEGGEVRKTRKVRKTQPSREILFVTESHTDHAIRSDPCQVLCSPAGQEVRPRVHGRPSVQEDERRF